MGSTLASASLMTLAFRALRKKSLLALGCGAAAIGLGVFSRYQWRRWSEQEDVKWLLAGLKSYENLQKKNFKYLADLSLSQPTPSVRNRSFLCRCVRSIREVNLRLNSYNRQTGVRRIIQGLKNNGVLHYQCLYDLPEYVSEESLGTLKSLQVLHMHIQSLFLLRLAIGLAEDELGIGDVKDLIKVLRQNNEILKP